jgi:diguanylate cyclase (GGDEF)-like protein/PAS domain S-box-containing protein
MRLEAEGELAKERERALAQTNRLSRIAIALAVAMLLAVSAFVALQRRGNRRLRDLLARLGHSELEYRTLADNSGDLVVRMALDGRLLYVSPSVRELLGREPDELAGLRLELVHPEERDAVRAAMAGVARDGGPVTVVYRARHRQGHYVWLESLARRVGGPDGAPEVVYSSRDVTARVRVEKALAASQARLRAVADNIPAMISHIDVQERYTFVNGFAGVVFSQSEADTIGHTVREVRGEEVYNEIRPRIREALSGERVSFEGQAVVHGERFHYQTNYVPDRAPDGSVQGFFSFTFDITKLKNAELELERQARLDGLTGLANRRAFDERTAAAVARGRRAGAPLALLYLDIDRFKSINDGHGHAGGDAVLREFARRLKANVREGDVVARIGGDEFVVLIESPESLAAVEAIAAKLVRAMQEPVELADGPLPVGTSIGIGWSRACEVADRLVAAADQALYAAKDAGRGCWRIVEID